MNSQRWDRIGEIYHSALPLGHSERASFVSDACSGDSTLQHEVELLLKADESSGDFLATDVFEVGLKILMDNSKSAETLVGSDKQVPDKLVGSVLDLRYRIENELGHGGVGAVYLARDGKLLDKRVVVKVLLEKSLQNEWVVQKFQQEKEALARVDHPGVVGILDTGNWLHKPPQRVLMCLIEIALRFLI
jgi:serine/threonine protein kinase